MYSSATEMLVSFEEENTSLICWSEEYIFVGQNQHINVINEKKFPAGSLS